MVELAMVIAIVAIMAGIAMPRLAGSAASSRVANAAENVAGVLRTARQTAIATSTSVRVTLQADTVTVEVIDRGTNTATDVSDILSSRPGAEEIAEIGAGALSAAAPADDRERARARRASLLAVQELAGRTTKSTASGTSSSSAVPWGARIRSPNFGGDGVIVFDGHGVPDSGGSVVVQLNSFTRRITVQPQTGHIEVAR